VILFLLLGAAVAGSALFAGLETGVVSLNRVRLRVRAGRGDGASRALLAFLERPERILSGFLIGNTLCNVGGGALAAAWASQRFGEAAGSLGATVVMTSVFLVFSEMIPKTFFRRHADERMPGLVGVLRVSTWVFYPLVAAISAIFRLISGSRGPSPFVTREELRLLVREAGGRLGAGQKRMLEKVFDFGRTSVREVMIPLPEVVSLSVDASTEDLVALVRRCGYTRIPLYRDRVDRIVGLVTVFDVLFDESPGPGVAGYLRSIHIVPETQTIPDILVELQRRREAMALVVNEFGACVGILTLEDIVEEILGELADEHEELSTPLQKVGTAWLLDASMDIDDLNAELDLSLRKDQFETVAGLLLKRLGRIPKVGEHVRVGNLDFEILAVHQYGLRRLKLTRLPAHEEGTGNDG